MNGEYLYIAVGLAYISCYFSELTDKNMWRVSNGSSNIASSI